VLLQEPLLLLHLLPVLLHFFEQLLLNLVVRLE
jgi:hypothetical protein